MVSGKFEGKIVCVIGLGYVGQPLAESFSKHLRTIGFDIDQSKINRIKNYNRHNGGLICTDDPSFIKEADFILICVPTPVTKHKEPDLIPIRSAAEVVGKNLKRGAIVVLESTVYPGVTEEILVPILERMSGMVCGQDFKVGYSPERVNPGDEAHSLDKITKIVSGMDDESTSQLAELYSLVTQVYVAKNIKTAEAAKVIENIQRDINIALINELATIFGKMGLDTQEVLKAAGTKWNFIRLNPGMVGGHCIPVDPYYLVYKARELGTHPQVILAGRATNDYMPKHIAELAIRGLNEVGKAIKGSKILIMGLTYKENVPDIRESPAREMINELKSYNADVYGYDPLIGLETVENFGVKPLEDLKPNIKFDCIIVTVKHNEFERVRLEELKNLTEEKLVLIDPRRVYDRSNAEGMGLYYASL